MARNPEVRRTSLVSLLTIGLFLFGIMALPSGSRATLTTSESGVVRRQGTKPEFVPGEVLVRYKTENVAKQQSYSTIFESDDGRVSPLSVEEFDGSEIVAGLRMARVAPEDTLAAVEALRKKPEVLYAEPNYIWHRTVVPNDPSFGELYGLRNTGQEGGTPDADIDADEAWNITQGSSNVVVGVIDSGVDVNHPDLRDNIWVNPGETANNNVDDDNNGFVDDVNGWDFHNNDATVFDDEEGDDHATHVAGIIGARGNNATGVVGVNWDVRIMSLKSLGPDGGTVSSIIGAYNYARTMLLRGVNIRVLNNSYGGPDKSQAAQEAIIALNQAGILFVAAAGNDTTDNFSLPQFPADYEVPNVINVASTTRFDSLSSFSNFGARIVAMGAPGSSILSTTPHNTYSVFSGTSMAAPQVAGAAALVLSANPNISTANLRGVLVFSGDVLPSLQDKTTTGRRLNVAAAVNSAIENGGVSDTTSPAVPQDLHVSSVIGRNVTLHWTAPGDDGMSGTAADYDFVYLQFGGGRLILPSTVAPSPGGSIQTATVTVPYLNQNGAIELRTHDNAGNFSAVSTGTFFIGQTELTDPYVTAINTGPEALTPGGTPLNLVADDRYHENFVLPFSFPYFGQARNTVTISTNGALYFSTPPKQPNGDAADLPSSIVGLRGQTMIAGLWDDLRTDRRAGDDVFVILPDSSRIIFRWQCVTFGDGTPASERPVNFEIELRNDGRVKFRYGVGQSPPINTDLFSVVGMSAGEPDAYIISSHSAGTIPKALTNADAVTFTPRTTSVPSTLQFSSSISNVAEGSNRINLTLIRFGDSTVAASVDYATADTAGLTNCNVINGVASSRCDYASSVGRISFAAGETSRSFSIPIVDDSYAEGNETFATSLSNPTGTILGSFVTANITITDNETSSGPNPIDQTGFFVRQHYIDFLGREPDPAGFAAWQNTISNCPSGDTTCDRIHVSGNFFQSPEFQQRGYFVYRLYPVAIGRKPDYAEFIPDLARVSGFLSDAQLEAARVAFINDFMARPAFSSIYNALSNTQYVDTLLGTAGITHPARDFWIAALGNGTRTRAQVLREIAESNEVYNKYYNQAFVVMQYFGYLRRDPDASYLDWIQVLNTTGDSRGMINGFVNSLEYRFRFGP